MITHRKVGHCALKFHSVLKLHLADKLEKLTMAGFDVLSLGVLQCRIYINIESIALRTLPCISLVSVKRSTTASTDVLGSIILC